MLLFSFLLVAFPKKIEAEDWDGCLFVLGEDDDDARLDLEPSIVPPPKDNCMSEFAELALVRGRVYEALENRPRAIEWYITALKIDVKCTDAFDRIVDKRMLGARDERELLEELKFPPGMEWLKLVYANKLDQYDPKSSSVPENIAQLEEAGFQHNIDIESALAHHHYNHNNYKAVYAITKV